MEAVATITDLTDARESLDYWERRARRLPRTALRRRREARSMAARWRERVSAAERAAYGRGITGALFMLACEQRLPHGALHRGRTVLKRVVIGAAVTACAMVAGLVALTALLVGALT
jgi:hypothetical protein